MRSALGSGVRGLLFATVFLASAVRAQSSARSTFAIPQWAFPTAPAPVGAPLPDNVAQQSIPESGLTFTKRQALNAYDVVDWFPGSHSSMPDIVRHGRQPDGRACGFCHLPSGAGRPENATLAGLSADYIARQVKAFRAGTRLVANPASKTNSMHLVAKSVTDADVAEAAKYFSAMSLTRRNRIVESSVVPRTRIEVLLYAYDGDGTEPNAGRLIEVPASLERHELHDPRVEYTTYVAPGSFERGRHLVSRGPNGAATRCAVCHGPQLLGAGSVPPIAGRSPSYLLRQLINFRSGARHDEMAALMQPVVTSLRLEDMIALAAYVGSLAPSASTDHTSNAR